MAGFLDSLGDILGGAYDTVANADYSWLNPSNFSFDVSKFLGSDDLGPTMGGGWTDLTNAPLDYSGSDSFLGKVGDLAAKGGGALWDMAAKDPMRTLGGLGGGAAMLYGMLGDEGKVKAPRMSPAQERMMALAEQSAADAAANKDDEVTAAYKQRVLKALNGEGDVDPRLQREQSDERAAMEARLLRELGPGALTSGQNNQLGAMIINDLNRKQGEARFTNARQILTQDEQSRQGAMNALNQGRFGAANAALGGFKGLSDFQDRGMQAQMFNKANKANKYKSAASGGATLFGYSLGGNRNSYLR